MERKPKRRMGNGERGYRMKNSILHRSTTMSGLRLTLTIQTDVLVFAEVSFQAADQEQPGDFSDSSFPNLLVANGLEMRVSLLLLIQNDADQRDPKLLHTSRQASLTLTRPSNPMAREFISFQLASIA